MAEPVSVMVPAKLKILSSSGAETQLVFEGRELIVGRGTSSDLRLSDLRVSRRHARLERRATDYYLEDLNSTNGTLCNGQYIRRCLLRDGDQVQIAEYRIAFSNPDSSAFEATERTRAAASVAAAEAAPVIAASPLETDEATATTSKLSTLASASHKEGPGRAFVRVLAGPDKGETKPVDKVLYTIKDESGQMATISRRPNGYVLLRLGGGTVPYVNNRPLKAGGEKLNDGDVIDFGAHQYRMIITSARQRIDKTAN